MTTQRLIGLRKSDRGWGPRLLVLAVVVYVGVLVLAPIVALVNGALQKGLPYFLASLNTPQFWQAFTLSVEIAVSVVVIQAILGSMTAWVIVQALGDMLSTGAHAKASLSQVRAKQRELERQLEDYKSRRGNGRHTEE